MLRVMRSALGSTGRRDWGRVTTGTVVYDSGMLVALLRGKPAAVVLDHALRAAAHRPIVIGPVLAQLAAATLRRSTHPARPEGLHVPQTGDSVTPIRFTDAIGSRCVACARTASLDTYKRAVCMLGKALLPPKKRPDAVDALVVVTAALHVPAQILTSDPQHLCLPGTLVYADIITETIDAIRRPYTSSRALPGHAALHGRSRRLRARADRSWPTRCCA